jgi:probable H4MPT-linked C1 transfer pathway protein
MQWLALDIGGANIKMADGRGYARSVAFALWREPGSLAQQLRLAIAEGPPCDRVAITMTGELADCFESKAEGVRFILQAVGATTDNRKLHVYLADGRFVSPEIAVELPHLAAASNWHALASFAGRYAPSGPALLIDVGSTTCDVIPLLDGMPVAKGRTDTQRLLASELVYTGVERSPVCAVTRLGDYRGHACPLTQELFATMRDVYIVLGDLAEEPADTNTADGRPATRSGACARLARMIAADCQEFNERDAIALASSVAEAQASLLAEAIAKVQTALPSPADMIILSGHGDFLVNAALKAARIECETISLNCALGPAISRCAPAHALAVLAREMTAHE